MSIGLKIKNLRKEKKLSVEELAAKIGASRQIIYEYESGRVIPTPTKIQQIAQVLDVSSSELQQMANMEDPKAKVIMNQDSVSWYRSLLDQIQEEKRQLMSQNERLTRLLELHLGKFSGCPFSTADSSFVSIWKNEESVEESVDFEPVLQRA